MKSNKTIDLVFLLVISIFAAVTSLLLKANFFISTLLFFGLPSLFISFKNKKAVKKSVVFAFLITVPFTFLFDYLITVDKGWHIVGSIFNFRIFGIVAIEQFVWTFLWAYQIIIFYEYFLDQHKQTALSTLILKLFNRKKELVSKRMELFSLILFISLLVFILLVFVNPSSLKINYAYFWLGLIFGIIPLSVFLIKFPNLWLKFIKITAYFFILAVIAEFVGLKLNHWIFPGNHYLGMIGFFGYRIPLEEFFLYFLISTPALLSYYEFLDDDRK